MSDVIRLTGMQFYAHHGVHPAERELGQRFEVDVELHADLSAAGRDDDLAAAVDYQAVYGRVRDAMEPPCRLLEAVAERIAAAIRGEFAVAAVVVRVRKPSVPMGGVLAGAEVEIRR
jgi:dihydroneopterin aldolase